MALCGINMFPSMESSEILSARPNLSALQVRPSLYPLINKYNHFCQRRSLRLRCQSSRENVLPIESEECGNSKVSICTEEDTGNVIKFNMSDFEIHDRVSVGLSGRVDEVIFEAVVKNINSPLYNSRVVLRRLTSVQAQRRGNRAIEVLKKLARRRLLYHSYSMQVYGYVCPSTSGHHDSFTLVHGYHGSYSLRHWLQQSDWLPTLEATLSLDEESVRRVGDDTVGGPTVSRQLRLIRLLMRDLLIGVNYLHSHGLAHTELRLENVHICPVDRHIKVGILGNAADFYDSNLSDNNVDANMDRRQMMIAFDMRCVGFIMAKMVLRELMDPSAFAKFKSFLTKGNYPDCLREFILQNLGCNLSYRNVGLQILDRNWGAGWNLLSLLLANKPSERIRCLDALRHPFLCGPRWRVYPSMDLIRWGLGSTAVRISEEYIYGHQQRRRLAHFIELMETLNAHKRPRDWLELLPGKWRLLYCTGRHIGLTLRQPRARVLIGNVHLNVVRSSSKSQTDFSFSSDIGFKVLVGKEWPHDKNGVNGRLSIESSFRMRAGRRLYLKEERVKKWEKAIPNEFPSSVSIARLDSSEIDVTLHLGDTAVDDAKNVIQEVRKQIPNEIFDLSRLVCGTYLDSRLLVLRGVDGSALFFTRSHLLDESSSK
ncbi:probable plastid-lipid-associated protein 14, chloroplastic [Impatiens glandulifera]|uniref:probable plastid-lipid-associated protein 14, chloroplastic n=1 Tax=Impatiens glandulifera TaxID=253017 RepID=UPI001FB133B1|nr:probable plastid-lipid-associated protein 14, chloroplastic [Impatiens glandulifera]